MVRWGKGPEQWLSAGVEVVQCFNNQNGHLVHINLMSSGIALNIWFLLIQHKYGDRVLYVYFSNLPKMRGIFKAEINFKCHLPGKVTTILNGCEMAEALAGLFVSREFLS